jgi:hypothetical protein
VHSVPSLWSLDFYNRGNRKNILMICATNTSDAEEDERLPSTSWRVNLPPAAPSLSGEPVVIPLQGYIQA